MEIRSRSLSKEGLENFDRIFGKKTPAPESCTEYGVLHSLEHITDDVWRCSKCFREFNQ